MIYQILLYLFDTFSIETKQLDAFKTNTRFNIHLQPLAPLSGAVLGFSRGGGFSKNFENLVNLYLV